MHQVAVLNRIIFEADELAQILNEHHIVVINSTACRQAQELEHQVLRAMQDSKGRGPDIIYSEFEVVLSPYERWFAPTFWHPERNHLNLENTGRIVQRAMEIWAARGSPNRFLYTNRARSS
jgi:hypothetical protein